MTEKELLAQLELMRESTKEAIRWLDMPPVCRKNLDALESAIQAIKEHRKSDAKIRQLKRSLRARDNRSVRRMAFLMGNRCHPQKEGA